MRQSRAQRGDAVTGAGRDAEHRNSGQSIGLHELSQVSQAPSGVGWSEPVDLVEDHGGHVTQAAQVAQITLMQH